MSSAKRKYPQVRLQERDLELLKDLHRSRVLSLAQLARRYFDGVEKRASERLRKLARGNFIEPLSYLDHDDAGHARRAFCLKARGLVSLRRRRLTGDEDRSRRYRLRLAPSQIRHQIILNEIEHRQGLVFERDHLGPRSGSRQQADARIKGTPGANGTPSTFLELDLGEYSRQRIHAKILGLAPAAKELVFVSPTQERASWIAAKAQEASVYYAQRCKHLTLADVLSGSAQLR